MKTWSIERTRCRPGAESPMITPTVALVVVDQVCREQFRQMQARAAVELLELGPAGEAISEDYRLVTRSAYCGQ